MRWRCGDCYAIFLNEEMLRAENPFEAEDEITGCPSCKSVNSFDLVCDFPGCTRVSSSSEPTPEGGYVHRCHEHSLWSFRRRAEKAKATQP